MSIRNPWYTNPQVGNIVSRMNSNFRAQWRLDDRHLLWRMPALRNYVLHAREDNQPVLPTSLRCAFRAVHGLWSRHPDLRRKARMTTPAASMCSAV
jgi:hypothetical protein